MNCSPASSPTWRTRRSNSSTGRDPTPSKQSRHLIVLENSYGGQLHIQIGQDALAARDFDKITLNWVDFD